MSETVKVWEWKNFPQYFGVMCFTVEGVGTILPVRSSMQNRVSFRPMFLYTFLGICIMLITFGTLGSFAFGSDLKDIVFLNFPKKNMAIFILQMIYGFGCILTFPIYINVTCGIFFRMKELKFGFEDHKRAY